MQAKDARTGVPAYSLTGSHSIEAAAAALAMRSDMPPILHLVPQEIADLLHRRGHDIEEDSGSAEYLFDTAAVVASQGAAFRQCRQYVSRFWRNPQARAAILDLANPLAVEQITLLCKLWHHKKVERGKSFAPHFWGGGGFSPNTAPTGVPKALPANSGRLVRWSRARCIHVHCSMQGRLCNHPLRKSELVGLSGLMGSLSSRNGTGCACTWPDNPQLPGGFGRTVAAASETSLRAFRLSQKVQRAPAYE